MKRVLAVLLVLSGLLYPFMVYFGLPHFGARWLALLLALIWLARAVSQSPGPGSRTVAFGAALACVVIAALDSPMMLRWYPVAINALLFGLFAASLRHGPPVIESIARLRDPALPARAVRYTRRVTVVWTSFFAINGLIAGLLALWGSWQSWTLYNGLISYILMGALMAVEYVVRMQVRRAA